jgi:hypothetical protein
MLSYGNHSVILSAGIYRNPMRLNRIVDHRSEMISMMMECVSIHEYLDGIEIGFRYPEEVYQFKLTEAQIEYVKSLRIRTAHFPYQHEIKDNNENRKLFKKIQEIYKQLGIQHTVFHPQYISDIHFLKNAWEDLGNGAISIESWIGAIDISEKDFEKLFVFDDIGIVLDTCHTAISSQARIGFHFSYFMPKFEDKIKYIHLSGIKSQPTFPDPIDPSIQRFCTGHHLIHTLHPRDLAYFEPVWILLKKKKNICVVLEPTIDTLDNFPNEIINEVNFLNNELK